MKVDIIKRSVLNFIVNHIIANIPFMCVRYFFYRRAHIKIGKNTIINMGQYILGCSNLVVGEGTHINQSCFLDARAGLSIGNNVSISHYVKIVTGSHDIRSQSFEGLFSPITIGDYAWVGIGATILKGVKIGKGSVICAGAVVTKDVPDFTVVGGVPAKKIGERCNDLLYTCCPEEIFV